MMHHTEQQPVRSRVAGALWGSLTGDALGVPVEFRSRAAVQGDPVTGMRGHGTHGQPAGTWSDDSSLLLCTVESLTSGGFSPDDLAARFVRWWRAGYWTPHGVVFDIGIATRQALMRAASGVPAEECGGRDEHDNGNGSLMRILPVSLRFAEADESELLRRLSVASRVTHAHLRSVMACFFHGFVVRALLRGEAPAAALASAQAAFRARFADADPDEWPHFRRLLDPGMAALPEQAIRSGGYVIDTLEAALWCLLNSRSFEDCVLRAVNLGDDTDTTGCVAGGLAGLTWGMESIPDHWIAGLARRDEVAALIERFLELPPGV